MRNVESNLAVTRRISVSAKALPTQLVRPAATISTRPVTKQIFYLPSPKGANARLSRIIRGQLYQRSGQNLWGSSQADSTISHIKSKQWFEGQKQPSDYLKHAVLEEKIGLRLPIE